MSNEFEEHIRKMEDFSKNRHLYKYEQLPMGEHFRKSKYDMRYDYEFIDDVIMPAALYFNSKSTRNAINSSSLYFVKINDNICEEYITGEKFIRYVNPKTGKTCFYNDKTGLHFNFNNYFEKAVGMIIDDVYTNNVIPFFDYFRELKREDDRLRSNSMKLMLTRGMNIKK